MVTAAPVRVWKCRNRRCDVVLGEIHGREMRFRRGTVDADNIVMSDCWADVACTRCGSVTRWWFRPGR